MGTFSLAERAGICALFLFLATPALAQSATATRLVTASPSPVGQPVTMTAEVDAFAGSAPRGTVTFKDGATTMGSASINPLGAGQATLAAGAYHTCSLASNGGVACWGANFRGQLGDGTNSKRPTPAPVTGLSAGVIAITAGTVHTCALTGIGVVKCWGDNFSHQLGDGTNAEYRNTPVTPLGLPSGIVAIAAGGGHTCALTSQGRVMCWGVGGSGQLGNGDARGRDRATSIEDAGTIYTAVHTGWEHSCGLTSEGAVKCWGSNRQGQIGDRTTSNRLLPVLVSPLSTGVSAVTTGSAHTCAITAGALKCWGSNESGQVGDGTGYNRLAPAQVFGLESGVVAATAAGHHSCALLNSGAVRCWGANQRGALGDGTTTKRYRPQPVSSLGGFAVAIASGGAPYGGGHSCALLSPSHTMRCWGENRSGQIGDGTLTNRLLPVTTTNFSGLLRGRARLARTLAAGVHPLQATYSGDTGHAPSASNVVQHRVQ